MSQKMSKEMQEVFAAFDGPVCDVLEAARDMILEIGEELDEVSAIEESLKWGQPSYVPKPKTGTPIRLGVTKSGEPTMFVHCQTTLVGDLERDNVHGLKTIDNRAVVLPNGDAKQHPGVRDFVRAALTYHL